MAPADYVSLPDEVEQVARRLGPADLVLLAAQALRSGYFEYAAAVCRASSASEPALRLVHAAALFGLGEQAQAAGMVDAVLAEQPGHPVALFYRAQMAQQLGEAELATRRLLELVQTSPDFPGALGALSMLRFPGPAYRDVLRRLHELVRPRSYLEIGIETGATLALAQHAQRIIGIDPDSSKLRADLVPPQARVFHETSDAFFEQRQRSDVLGAERLDLAFIDGMHRFEYALRDFIHVEAWSHPDAVVVLHDCVPILPVAALRERRTRFWVGDVWKLVAILQELRPDLRVRLIATAPSGLCVVRGLDPASRVLSERLDEVVARYHDLPYPAAPLEVPEGLTIVPASEQGLRAALQ